MAKIAPRFVNVHSIVILALKAYRDIATANQDILVVIAYLSAPRVSLERTATMSAAVQINKVVIQLLEVVIVLLELLGKVA